MCPDHCNHLHDFSLLFWKMQHCFTTLHGKHRKCASAEWGPAAKPLLQDTAQSIHWIFCALPQKPLGSLRKLNVRAPNTEHTHFVFCVFSDFALSPIPQQDADAGRGGGTVCLAAGDSMPKAQESALTCGQAPQQHPFSSSCFSGAWSPPGSGHAVRLYRNNLFVQGQARSESSSRVSHKRETGEERISCIEVIWAAVLLLYPCWSEDTVSACISGGENHGNRNLVHTLIYCHQDICQVPGPWEKCIFHQYYIEISIRRINALNNCQGTLRNVPETWRQLYLWVTLTYSKHQLTG